MAEEDGLKELYEAQRDTQEKYAYFLLAAAGAVIGFAVTRSSDAPLTRLHVPLGFAVLCWGWSFYLGCRRSLLSQTIMHMNAELLRVQLGRSSLVGSDPEQIAHGMRALRELMDERNNKIGRSGAWQFYLLIMSAVFFVAWHVLEMLHKARAPAFCI